MRFVLGMALMLLCAGAVAAAQGQEGPPGPPDLPPVPTLNAAGQDAGQGAAQGTQTTAQTAAQAATQTAQQTKGSSAEVAAIKARVQERSQAMEGELAGKGPDEQKVYRNQNQVRETVHVLLALGEMGIGPKVSEIARGFNNSVQATIQAELKIERRSGLARLFAGGDHEAAKEIAQEVERNRERIRELQTEHDTCDCDESVKAMLQEQIRTMEQEQGRLEGLAQQERSKKGLLGWIWK